MTELSQRDRASLQEPSAASGIALPADVPTRTIEPRKPGLLNIWREFWRYRGFLGYFGRKFLLKRFANTWLGWLWLPLRPVVMLAARILIFGGLIGIPTGKTPYALVFVIATATWTLFAETAYWSARSIELNRKMLRDIYVPKLTLIASSVIPSFVEFGIYVCLAIAGVLYYVVRADIFYLDFGVKTLLVPLGLFFVIMLGLGVGLLTASAGARARDIRFSLGYILGFVYFVSPVIYPLSVVPPKWRPVAELNPLTGAIEMVKDGLFASHELSSDAVLVTAIAVLVVWIPGLWLFDRREVGLLHGQPRPLIPSRLRIRRARG